MSYPEGIEVIGVSMSDGESDKLMYSTNAGQLRISWYNLEAMTLQANESLFTLKLRLTSYNKNLDFDLNASSEIADRNAERVDNVKLSMPALVVSYDDYALSNNYPNPFNQITTIEYKLPESGKVLLRVFNLVGEEIGVLVNEEQEAGTYKVDFDGSGLASGGYMYKIEVEGESRNFIKTRMMVVNR